MDPLNLSRVEISWDVLWSCLSHALSTEHQEIMGLLLGSLEGEKGAVAIVRRSIVLSRKDKKKDRVEVGYENLAAASTVAERLAGIDFYIMYKLNDLYVEFVFVAVNKFH